MNRRGNGSTDDEKGLLWKLPQVRLKDVGRVGPAFGIGAGCGLGFGLGIIGGAGFGPGIPGLQVGFGFGAGCGVGLGFGYGVGRGVAYDENRTHSNVGQLFHAQHALPTQDDIDSLIDEIVINTKKLVRATTREIDKWRSKKMIDKGKSVAEEEREDGKIIPGSEGAPSNMEKDKEEEVYKDGDEEVRKKGEEEDDDDDDDVTEEGEELSELEGEVATFKIVDHCEYEALAEKKRKALSDRPCEVPEKRAKHDTDAPSYIHGVMEAMYYGGRRRSRKLPKRRGRRKGSKNKVTPEITRMLGDATLHYVHGRYSEAVSVLEKVIRLAPDLADAYHTLGLVHHAIGKTELAMEAYKIAAGIKQQDSSLWKLLYDWSMEKGDILSACNYASKAIQADPDDATLRLDYASLCLETGKDQKAAESYEQIFRRCPANIEALMNGAKLYLKCGQGERSINILEDYLKSHLSEADLDVIDLLAVVFMKINAFDRALKHIEDVKQIYFTEKALPLKLKIREAICHIHLGQAEQSEIVLGILPPESVSDHLGLINELADAYMSFGNFHSALKYYHKLEGVAGLVNAGDLHLKIGHCYLSLMEKAQAITFFYRGVHELKDHVEARLTLASLLLEDAKVDEAISVLSPPDVPNVDGDERKGWWRNTRIRMKLCQVFHSVTKLEDFVNVALPLILEWVWRKVKGKRRRSVHSLCERVEHQQTKTQPCADGQNSPLPKLRPCRMKKLRKMRATLNEAKKIGERAAFVDPKDDNSNESQPESSNDEEYHCLFVDLLKALASLQRYWEALEIVNLARRLDCKMLPVEKKKELQSLGAQISCDAMDPKQWFDCVRSVIHQHPYRLAAWNCYYRVISRLGKKIGSEAKFIHHMRSKYKDCLPPILISGHQFTLTSRHQDAAREYLEAYKLLPENSLINLCAGTALINLALGFRLQNKHQCLAQGFAFLYNNLRISENSQEALYNIARAYHHVGLVTLAASYYQKVLEIYEKDYPMPKLPNEDPGAVPEDRKPVCCDLRREAAYNLHLIYKNSGAFDLARHVLMDHCTF